MRACDLKEVLEKTGIDRNAYEIDGAEYPNEAYVMLYSGSEWQVYYSERGKKRKLIQFADESEACNFFLKWISRTQQKKGKPNKASPEQSNM